MSKKMSLYKKILPMVAVGLLLMSVFIVVVSSQPPPSIPAIYDYLTETIKPLLDGIKAKTDTINWADVTAIKDYVDEVESRIGTATSGPATIMGKLEDIKSELTAMPTLVTYCLTAAAAGGAASLSDLGMPRYQASKEVSGIGGKTVTFLGGGISGGAAWSQTTGGGSSPGIGYVLVYEPGGTAPKVMFALPLNSMFTVQNVDRIIVYAEVRIPYISAINGYASYEAFVVASVIYTIEQ